jgi:hypothetical protein
VLLTSRKIGRKTQKRPSKKVSDLKNPRPNLGWSLKRPKRGQISKQLCCLCFSFMKNFKPNIVLKNWPHFETNVKCYTERQNSFLSGRIFWSVCRIFLKRSGNNLVILNVSLCQAGQATSRRAQCDRAVHYSSAVYVMCRKGQAVKYRNRQFLPALLAVLFVTGWTGHCNLRQ